MTTKKIIYLTLGGVATAGVGYLVYSLLKKKPVTFNEGFEDIKNTVVNAPKEIVSTISGNYTDKGFPLKKGSGGEKVKSLQRYLNNASGYNLVVDGKFGNLTESAVLSEQSPFDVFKGMHPEAVKGQVSESFYKEFIEGKF